MILMINTTGVIVVPSRTDNRGGEAALNTLMSAKFPALCSAQGARDLHEDAQLTQNQVDSQDCNRDADPSANGQVDDLNSRDSRLKIGIPKVGYWRERCRK